MARNSQNDACTDDEEVTEEKPTVPDVWWHVNKNGFPLCEATWEKMWSYILQVHPQGEEVTRRIRGQKLKKVPYPVLPLVSGSSRSLSIILDDIQRYMNDLQYNHTGTQFFEIKKNRPVSRLMETAKEMIRESLPIKCLEATILGLYLTAPLTAVCRVVIGFKTKFSGRTYRHVVLGVTHGGSYGALGLSRRRDLMYKPLEFKTLPDLLANFTTAYENNMHTVCRICVSAPIVHDIHSCEKIHWKECTVYPTTMDHSDVKRLLEKHSRILRTFSE